MLAYMDNIVTVGITLPTIKLTCKLLDNMVMKNARMRWLGLVIRVDEGAVPELLIFAESLCHRRAEQP
jgi:hypothetical protein